MGFNKVYRSLQDVFPQIDARVLRAVAIEHSKDADAAVESVLTEIIPFFNERSRPSTPLTGGEFVGERSRPSTPLTRGELLGERSTPSTPLTGGELLGEISGPSTPVIGSEPILESSADFTGATSTLQPVDVPFLNSMDSTEDHITAEGEKSFRDADDGHKEPVYDTYDGHHEGECVTADRDNVNTARETNGSITAGGCTENGIKVSPDDIPCQTLGMLQVVDVEISENLNPLQGRVEYGHLEAGHSTPGGKETEHEKLLADASSSVVSSASVTLDEQPMMSSESNVQLVVLNDKHGSNTNSLNDVSQIECGSDATAAEDANLNESMSQASQAHLIEVLEQAIGDARYNKKILSSTMQSVISLMREVELKEDAAEQAKVEAAMGGSDVLAKVEELQQMILRAKEANSMHAGEVHGEKSILASELRELQSRVYSLSEDRDESLAVLDEMRHALQVRLDEAEDEINSAEQRKVEKEKAAMKALADEELIMEKVVQEAKMLKQQAEDNAKLQEFLMDRGQIVDMLQGEIAVICQDVRLLKDKFDEHVPFSKSLLFSQTGRMLVSSTSSSNGLNMNLLKENFDEHLPLSKSLSSSHTSCISASSASSSGQTLNKVESVSNRASRPMETEKRDRFNELAFMGLEEGWELFDRSETFG